MVSQNETAFSFKLVKQNFKKWYDLDYEQVITLRKQYYYESEKLSESPLLYTSVKLHHGSRHDTHHKHGC